MIELWIFSEDAKADRQHLESLGVCVGQCRPVEQYGTSGVEFDCRVDDDALRRLQPFWFDRYVWGPKPGQVWNPARSVSLKKWVERTGSP